jgi:dTDP-4-dehydrorhamnose 3,5-epimerase
MKFEALAIADAKLITPQPAADERGHFARLWCEDSFAQAGLTMAIAQTSVSFNRQAGTVRGMHFAWAPAQEAKLVRCARGRMQDVLLDLRPFSVSYLRWVAVLLIAEEYRTLYIPPGVAHGFQTAVDDTEVHYMMSERYLPELLAGVRYDDPQFGIHWPLPVSQVSERDRNYADFDPEGHLRQYQAAHNAAQQAAQRAVHHAA